MFPRVQVVLIHSRIGLADPELLSSVRQQAKEVLLQKGVELLLGTKTSFNPQTGPGSDGLRSELAAVCFRSESVQPVRAAAERHTEEHGGVH